MANKLKPLDYKLLFKLMKGSKRSDRKLAQVLGVSQPTVTRKRIRLENMGLLNYTAIPNFKELGLEIMAFTPFRCNHEKHPNRTLITALFFVSL